MCMHVVNVFSINRISRLERRMACKRSQGYEVGAGALPLPTMGPKAHRSRSISDVSFTTVSVLSFDPVRVRALCV